MLALLFVLHTALAQEPPNACGALALPGDNAATWDLLDGFLRLPEPPGSTPFEIPHSIMGPAIPVGEGTLWFFNAGTDRMGMLTQRMHMIATARFPDDVLEVLDPTMHRAQIVAADGTPGVAWWGDVGPGDGNDVHALDVLWRVKNGELVQTSFLLDDKTAAHGEGCTGYALALAKRLSAGARDVSLAAHTVQIALTPTRALSIDLPDGAVMVSRPGPDFTVVDIDLNGTFHVLRAGFEHLRRPGACVLNISAPQAFNPTRFQAHVCAAKAGVDMLTRVLAMEWGPEGVRVNSIVPGPIGGTEGIRRLAPTPEALQRMTESVPLQRMGRVEEIADMALFLASPHAAFVTGAIMVVDGGSSLAGGRDYAGALA